MAASCHAGCCTATESNLGFSVLPKDTSTCGLEEPGIEPLTFRLVDDALYLLRHSRPLDVGV